MSDSSVSDRPERKAARDRRSEQLLEAARQVFAKKGYHAATVDDITRAAGVAKGTFYLYFGEKPAIFYELIHRFFELVTKLGRSVSQDAQTPADYYQQVERAATALTELFRDNRDLVRLVYRESMGLDDKLEQMVRDFYRGLAKVEADNIRLGMSLGLFREDLEPMVVAYAHIGLIERVLLASLFDRDFPQVPNLVQQMLDLTFNSVRRLDPQGLDQT